jgi:hypothetical protein
MTKETEMTAPTPRTVASRRCILAAGLAAAIVALALALCVGPASAASPAPGFTIHSLATPNNFSAADTPGCITGGSTPNCDAYVLTARNAGSRPTSGSPLALTDVLPAGLTVQRIAFTWEGPGARAAGLEGLNLGGICDTTTVSCEFLPPRLELPFPLQPDDILRMTIYVTVDPGLHGPLTNSATISGGGAPAATATSQNQIGSSPPSFGPAGLSFHIAGPDGVADTQAGDHPYELTTLIDLNNLFRDAPDSPFPRPDATSVEDPKNIVVDLPLGFLGSATASPTCTFAQLSSHISAGSSGCPTGTVVGHIDTTARPSGTQAKVDGPIYNMVPEHGVAAEFAFVDNLAGSHVLYARVVPGPSGYVLQVTSPDIPQIPLTGILTTFFGNPAAKDNGGSAPAAMFTNPANCNGQPLTTSVHMDSWQHPGSFNADGTPNLTDPNWASATSTSPPVTGCNKLHFDPMITVQPDSTSADSSSGLDVEIKVPQSEDPNTLATPPLKKGVVALPPGVAVNPSFADGLGACSPAQIDLASAAEPSCPAAAKVGTVELQTPLLPGILHGSIFLATQTDNPFHTLLAGYIVVDDPATGVVIKVPGNLTPDPVTGQITGVFDNNPQFPFSDLKLHFFGGDRGELVMPNACGTYTTTSELTPWSAPDSGPPATPSDSFTIRSGPGGGACPDLTDPARFTPSFEAGTVSPVAGQFSPFVLKVTRPDGQQSLKQIHLDMPPGLLAKLAGVPRCPQSAIVPGVGGSTSCPPGSQIGVVSVSAGAGSSPFFLAGQPVYLSDGYDGAPFGIAIDTHALAGPFDLGHVVVRSQLNVDPEDATAHVDSEPLPGILQGIPLHIRSVLVKIDRPGFTLNPTSCNPMAFTGTVTGGGADFSAPGDDTVKPVSNRFQVGGCRELAFKPSFTASTQGKTSKANGASLTVKVAQKPSEANIRKVVLQLPIALPSRLTTLQKACTEAQFNANPAACPVGSFIGTATAHTPLLNAPLTGPAILVSHGGAGFPDVEFLLQGEGVHITLDGKTDIKKGITFSRFETVPDAPISSFETVLPEGPHSVLAAFENLCSLTKTVTVTKHITKRLHGHTIRTTKKVKHTVTQPLVAPTTITGQNGAQLTQATKIAVTGCPKPKIKKNGKKGSKK